jgi:hypothetical protein
MASLQKPLHIDIPVKLAEIKVAFSVAALAFVCLVFYLSSSINEMNYAEWHCQ